MKRILLMGAVLAAACGTANAGRNANGAMVVHVYTGPLNYTNSYNLCTDPEFDLPATCQDLATQSDDTVDEVTMLWLVAAFGSGSSPGVTTLQFGIQHNLPPGQGYFEAWSPCGPGFIELPDAGWPQPNDCGDLVAYSTAVYGLMFKFYYFAVWHDDDTNFFSTRTYPSTGEAKFVDDGNPPVEDLCTLFGTMRWGLPGQNACPGGHPPGACCFADGHCQMLLAEDCAQQGGLFYQDWGCDPNPCGPPPPGACCFDSGLCELTNAWDCPGTFMGFGTDCDPNPCPPAGACCLDMNGTCVILIATACEEQNGTYQGDGTTCEPVNPCFGFPTEHTTWGRIRAQFR